MANVRSGNTFYCDSTGTLASSSLRIYYIMITPLTAAAHSVTLQNDTTSVNILTITHAAGDSHLHPFDERPLYCPGGVKISAITNCIVTLVTEEK